MLFAVYVCVSGSQSFSLETSHLAAPVESLCENFLQPENQTHCVIVVRVRHNLLQRTLIAAR